MQIETIVCTESTEDKLVSKHNVTCREAHQVLVNEPRIRFAETGNIEGENVYAAFGRTEGGSYLSVFFIYKPQNKTAIIISARGMTDKERRTYGRK